MSDNERETNGLAFSKSDFSWTGIVNGLDNENAFVEETSKKSGLPYRRFRFGVQTSPNNTLYIELLGAVQNEIRFWNGKFKEEKQTIERPFKERLSPPNGFTISNGIGVSLWRSEDGNKLIKKMLHSYDACKEIHDNLRNGMSVNVSGSVEFNNYETQDGRTVMQHKYVLKYISLTKNPIDFETNDFKEKNDFRMNAVVNNIHQDHENHITEVSIYQIFGKGTFKCGKLVVRTSDSPDDNSTKLANALAERLNFGDTIDFGGKCISTYLVQEIVEENTGTDVDPFSEFGEMPDSYNSNYVKGYINELRITGVDSKTWMKERYTESQFAPTEDPFSMAGIGDPFS